MRFLKYTVIGLVLSSAQLAQANPTIQETMLPEVTVTTSRSTGKTVVSVGNDKSKCYYKAKQLKKCPKK